MKVLNFYNYNNKLEFINNIEEESRRKLAKATFNKISKYEYKLRKDVYSFTQNELVNAFLDSLIVLYRPYMFGNSIINDWRKANERKPITLPNEEVYKQLFIEQGRLEYVINMEELLLTGYDSIQIYSNDKGFDYTSYFLMPLLYEVFVFLGLDNSQIESIQTKQITSDYTLPNGTAIKDARIKQLIDNVAGLDHYVCNNPRGEAIKKYYEDSPMLIKQKCSSLKSTFEKLDNPLLRDAKVRKAATFNRLFEKDISAHNFQIELSRYQLEHKLSDGDLAIHGLTYNDEEMYNLYKAIRIKHNK